jgi:hypothetical protein
LTDTIRIGYLSGLALMAGIVSLLRTSGRGRCGWEPATLVIVACLPPVWLCLENFFHPQDLLAMGFALGAMACARRDSWIAAGILVTAAILSQQFAVLVAAPLLMLAPTGRRLAYVGAGVATAFLAITALLVTTSLRAAEAALVGTGNTGGVGTVLATLNLRGAPLVFSSRVLPLALSLMLSWWVVRRLRSAALEPVALVSLVAVSLSLRLIFEQALFGYYFMALAVTLVLLDVIGGHIRGSLVAWLAMVTLVFLVGPTTSYGVLNREPWGNQAQDLLTVAVILLAILMITIRVVRSARIPDLLVWLGLVAGAILVWPSTNDPLSNRFPTAYWQVVLVLLGLVLAARPLLKQIQQSGERQRLGDVHAAPFPPITSS